MIYAKDIMSFSIIDYTYSAIRQVEGSGLVATLREDINNSERNYITISGGKIDIDYYPKFGTFRLHDKDGKRGGLYKHSYIKKAIKIAKSGINK